MINISNEVYDKVVKALKAHDNSIETSSVYTNTPSKYPFVSIEEIENLVDYDTSDCCNVENHAEVQYEINIYTKNPKKREKAYEILEVVDELLGSYNFVRISKNNFQDANETTYLLVARYSAVVSKEHVIYRR